MRVAVIDVGANTVRLVIADHDSRGMRVIKEQKARLSLGADVELEGALGEERIAHAAETVGGYARIARKLGVARLDVLITSPGRQAENGEALADALSAAAGAAARILSSEEEGALAYRGACGSAESSSRTLVCDIGGGSTQLIVGDGHDLLWQASMDIGSLRLTRRHRLGRKEPGRRVEVARAEVEQIFGPLSLPLVDRALVAGGTARALAAICGPEFSGKALAKAVETITQRSPIELSERYPVGRWRAERLLAGALILSVVQERVGLPFRVGSGGIREGALQLMAESVAA